MDIKKIKCVLYSLIILISVVFLISYFYNRRLEKIEKAYLYSYGIFSNTIYENTEIDLNNRTEKIIYDYFDELNSKKLDIQANSYERYKTENLNIDFYKNVDVYNYSIKSFSDNEFKLIEDYKNSLKKEAFIKYLKSNKVDNSYIRYLNFKIKGEYLSDIKEINSMLEEEKSNYDSLIKYNEYLISKRSDWHYNDGIISCNDNYIKNIIIEKNKEFDIELKVELDQKNVTTITNDGNSKKIPVLMYHGVSDTTWGIAGLFMKVKDFDNQMKYIHDNYETIFIEDIEKNYSNKKVIALTFDDGYVDFYTNVLPILKKYNLKANLYTIVNAKGSKYLSDNQIIEINNSGLVSIGSHTVSHNNLRDLSDSDLEKELKDSKEHFQKLLGKEIKTICYPTGAYNSKVLKTAKKYYEYGLAIGNIVESMDKSFNKYAIKRFRVYRTTSFDDFKNMVDQAN